MTEMTKARSSLVAAAQVSFSARSSPKGFSALPAAASSSARSGGSLTPKSSKGATSRRQQQQRARQAQMMASPLVTAGDLRARAVAWRERAASVQAKSPPPCLEAWKLSAAIFELAECNGLVGDAALRDLFQRWDEDSNEVIDKAEFISACKAVQLDGVNELETAVDELYALLDLEDGGDIDLREFIWGIETLSRQARARNQQEEACALEYARLHACAAAFDEAAAATTDLEVGTAALEHMLQCPSIERRVGEQLTSCRAKLSNLWSDWVRNADGRLQLQAQGDGRQRQILSRTYAHILCV